MGRKPTRNLNLPAGMRARHRGGKTYYFLDTGEKPRREVSLGQDYVEAVQKWGQMTTSKVAAGELITFRHVAERYMREIVPTKAEGTQEINLRELASLYRFFDSPPIPLDDIDPVHVRQYLDWRAAATLAKKKEDNAERVSKGRAEVKITGKEGQVPANREKALLSHIWNFARERGLTNKANPCAGVKGFREEGRDVYIDDDLYALVYSVAEEPLKDALDLAYLTGQRPADVLKLSRSDIKEGALMLRQNKTRTKLRIAIEGQLATLIERISSRKVMSLKLVNSSAGTPLTRFELRGAFDRARAAATSMRPDLAELIKEYQFRDLRAKAGTDTEEVRGIAETQAQLGHSTPMMTAQYVRHRRGKKVKPTK